ncbi:hypothetical protein DDT54_11135 [Brenneria nigrifluens DSM 30175 = ATCC 13028]|uniref:Uncharacterized protein n=1 Tax=Brenneria nigrifluens DSM 30175 = ATCC 13028 TaxID=1121120 RepID=A0A2U1UR74_9GAMM|nr:hypothetical protein DDT54_11135 [Brenneria nigrifluens DSM 30175 = ATCC 13028]
MARLDISDDGDWRGGFDTFDDRRRPAWFWAEKAPPYVILIKHIVKKLIFNAPPNSMLIQIFNRWRKNC